MTKTIGRLLDGYDIRLRPNFGGEQVDDDLHFSFQAILSYYATKSKFNDIFVQFVQLINEAVEGHPGTGTNSD